MLFRSTNPTFYGLFGRVEYEMAVGHVYTHFTNIKGGSLHRANEILKAAAIFFGAELDRPGRR